MRLRFTSKISSLKPERVIATLWGCIQRRFKQKGVKWDNAKNICIRYNEEPARVRVRVREVDQIMIARAKVKELILGDIERLLELGDKAILTTESKQSLKVVMAV